ncbi:unnamed protein product [Rotaria sp. Silwood1]|nr:unnamed protein product [Rotaria sp. Silwood1]CAF3865777.1 unnamed protein product [Rotaria sp. Silwood1]CAF4816192.1 unnamed protein product [Rotaria sp. Silwood1]
MVSWRYIAVLYAQYFGMTILILGILGDILNIYIFSTVRSYRETPATFYLLGAVIANFIQLILAITTRIINVGFNNDLTSSSLAWCKIRQFIVATYPNIALTCECLATIDQFLVTSRHVRLRQLSNIKNAHRIAAVCVVIWHLQVTFGFLAYKNMRQLTHARQLPGADRQLVIMVCLQLLFVVVEAIPFGSYNTYILLTSNRKKDAEQMDKDFLFLTVTSLLGSFNFGSSFYIFLIASSRFRQIVRERLFCLCKKPNQVYPETRLSIIHI